MNQCHLLGDLSHCVGRAAGRGRGAIALPGRLTTRRRHSPLMPDQELLDDFLEALETARSLKNLPGSWSDLALACLIHVGM
jgi:hypothetical protein